MSESNYTDEQRKRIIQECAQWYCELKHSNKQETSKENLREFITERKQEADSELEETWYTTVGEWLAARSDISIPESLDHESWLSEQFECVVNDDPRDYNFLFEIPPTTVEKVDVDKAEC